MKKCPFCGKEIAKHLEKCPHCNRILIEKVPHREQVYHAIPTVAHKYPQKTERVKEAIKKLRRFPVKWVVGASVILLLVIIALADQTSIPVSMTLPTQTVQPAPVPTQTSHYIPIDQLPSPITVPDKIEPAVLETYVSNGTILKSRSAYLQGDGELEIKNGTSQDAVAKLIVGSTSIFTVYITAGSTYTIRNISDGYYDLAFALGNGWDATNKVFVRNRSYEKFDDGFNYKTYTTEDSQYVHTHYTAFTVSLNPVVGGTATTGSVDPNEFDNY